MKTFGELKHGTHFLYRGQVYTKVIFTDFDWDESVHEIAQSVDTNEQMVLSKDQKVEEYDYCESDD
jgi:hypothetical protein